MGRIFPGSSFLRALFSRFCVEGSYLFPPGIFSLYTNTQLDSVNPWLGSTRSRSFQNHRFCRHYPPVLVKGICFHLHYLACCTWLGSASSRLHSPAILLVAGVMELVAHETEMSTRNSGALLGTRVSHKDDRDSRKKKKRERYDPNRTVSSD